VSARRRYRITLEGRIYDVEVEEVPIGQQLVVEERAVAAPREGAVEEIRSPLPGNVLSVKVQPGQQVKNGDLLLVVESMKLENEILAPRDGTVRDVRVLPGANVSIGDLLVILE
jgi:biotin carboxyl carrier protein